MPSQTTDRFAELRAPAQWQAVDFISDLHLQASEPATYETWRAYLHQFESGPADALFILGDLFEVWVGDDVLLASSTGRKDSPAAAEHTFLRDCAAALRQVAQSKPVYFMHGNRDFLLGQEALNASGMQFLADPTLLVFHGQPWLLSHGDALCLDDTEYMQFRAQVRQASWQADFLARPLAEREALARQMRAQSEAKKKAIPFGDQNMHGWADVDPIMAAQWLQNAEAHTLIHGHTHRPGVHQLRDGLKRVVLSDWDSAALPPRAEVLRLDANGLQRLPVPVGTPGGA